VVFAHGLAVTPGLRFALRIAPELLGLFLLFVGQWQRGALGVVPNGGAKRHPRILRDRGHGENQRQTTAKCHEVNFITSGLYGYRTDTVTPGRLALPPTYNITSAGPGGMLLGTVTFNCITPDV
jgi:hypothetical protein